MSICISTHCKKYSTCKLAHPKDDKIHEAINWHDSGSYATGYPTHLENGAVIYNPIRYYDCGEQGCYAKYEPIKLTHRDKLIQMSVEEMAKWLVQLTEEQPYAGATISYWNFKDDEYTINEEEAINKTIEWLNSEVDN